MKYKRIDAIPREIKSALVGCEGEKKQLCQRAKKVVSNSPGLVDFAIGLVNSVRKSSFLRNSKYSKICEIKSAHKKVSGLVEITFGPVKAIFSWSEWQAVKMTFFAS